MIWSFLYDALSTYYSGLEQLGEIDDDQLADKLAELRAMDKHALSAIFNSVYNMDTPEDL